MARLTLKITGLNSVQKKMDKFVDEFGKFKEPVRKTFQVVRDDYGLQFRSQGSFFGFPWKRLAERTQREREILGFSASVPIHQRTGGLRDSIAGLGRGHVEKVSIRKTGVTMTMETRYKPGSRSRFGGASGFEIFPTLNRLRRIRAEDEPGFIPTVTRIKVISIWQRHLNMTVRRIFN